MFSLYNKRICLWQLITILQYVKLVKCYHLPETLSLSGFKSVFNFIFIKGNDINKVSLKSKNYSLLWELGFFDAKKTLWKDFFFDIYTFFTQLKPKRVSRFPAYKWRPGTLLEKEWKRYFFSRKNKAKFQTELDPMPGNHCHGVHFLRKLQE